MLGNSACASLHVVVNLKKKSLWNTTSVSNSLDPDQVSVLVWAQTVRKGSLGQLFTVEKIKKNIKKGLRLKITFG